MYYIYIIEYTLYIMYYIYYIYNTHIYTYMGTYIGNRDTDTRTHSITIT